RRCTGTKRTRRPTRKWASTTAGARRPTSSWRCWRGCRSSSSNRTGKSGRWVERLSPRFNFRRRPEYRTLPTIDFLGCAARNIRGAPAPASRRTIASSPAPGKHTMPLLPLAIIAALLISRGEVSAQPAPSIYTTCEALVADLRGFDPPEGDLVVIEVTGRLAVAEVGDGLAYMGVCGEDAPKVMCVTYKLNGFKDGDDVTVIEIGSASCR